MAFIVEGGGTPGCTIDDFRKAMAYYASQNPNFLGWYNKNTLDPVLDVTDKVNEYLSKYGSLQGKYAVVKCQSIPCQVEKAKLIIYGDDQHASQIKAVGVGPTEPAQRSLDAIVQGWAQGEEKERQYCQKDGEYYWVTYPCDLAVELQSGAWVWLTRKNTGTQPSPTPSPTPNPSQVQSKNLLPYVVAGGALVVALILLTERG